jgi:hypothetical protein
MKRRSTNTALVATLVMVVLAVLAPMSIAKPNSNAELTQLKVYNATSNEVFVWWNSETPNARQISVTDQTGGHPQVKIPNIFSRGEKGQIALPAGYTITIASTSGSPVLNGTITFDCIPVCPCGGGGSQPPCPQVGTGFNLPTQLVNGVNQAEFALNTIFESVDISCVNGANSKLEMEVKGGTPQWIDPVTKNPVIHIKNGSVDVAARVDDNCSRLGVFPFNATDCIKTPNPPCGQPICFHKQRDCQLDRKGQGGTVTIVIKGFEAL